MGQKSALFSVLTECLPLWQGLPPFEHVLASDSLIMSSELFSVILVAHAERLGTTLNMLKLETLMLG